MEALVMFFYPLDDLGSSRHITMEFDPLYEELDQQIRQTAERTGWRCPPGCGACCQTPSKNIEASEDELRPLARNLWAAGGAEAVLEQARGAGAEGWCALYEPGPGPTQGRCTAYEFRPLTCRLFGSSAVRDKAGRPRATLSAVMKAADPGLGQRVEDAVARGLDVPVAAEWRLRMAEVSPRATVDLLPLNVALVRALQTEGLVYRYTLEQVKPTSP
jgi:Fe-S-cluster containining protein